LHSHPYSSKFPAFASQFGEKVRSALADNGGDGAGIRGEFEFGAAAVGNADAPGKGARQVPAHDSGQRLFMAPTGVPAGEHRIGGKYPFQGLRVTHHGRGSHRGHDVRRGLRVRQREEPN